MKRIITTLLFFVICQTIAASPIAAAPPRNDYSGVKHLYQLALKAIDEIEDTEERDLRATDLALEVLEHGDHEAAERILASLTVNKYKAELAARLAYVHAREGDCVESAGYAARVTGNREFLEEIKHPRGSYRRFPHMSLKSLTRALALCGKLAQADRMIEDFDPGSMAIKQFRTDAYSSLGSALHLAGRIVEAKEYFERARAIARPLEDETHRSSALWGIATNEYITGLYEDAYKTALEILPTKKRPDALALPYNAYRNQVLQDIAYHYARLGEADRASIVLRARKELMQDFLPEGIVAALLATDKLGPGVTIRAHLLEIERRARETAMPRDGLIQVAIACAQHGFTADAQKILEPLFEEFESENDSRQLSDYPHAVLTLDKFLHAFVRVYGSPQKALSILHSQQTQNIEPRQLKRGWGAIIGYALKSKNDQLLTELKTELGEEFDSNALQYGAWRYLLEENDFEAALAVAENMVHRERADAYLAVARTKMGIGYFDHLHNTTVRLRN